MFDQKTFQNKPEATQLTRESIEQLASRVSQQLKFDAGADVEKLIDDIGGRVEHRDFWSVHPEEAGSLEVVEEGNFTVYIPYDASPAEQRFTVAHELGHYILHFLWKRQVENSDIKTLIATRYGSDRPEWEANMFAFSLLMPETEFKSTVESEGLDAAADKFRVSRHLAKVRNDQLDSDS